MRRINIAVLAIIAAAGFGATAQAREAQAGASTAQTPGVQQSTAKKHGARHLRRAGTATAGSDSFLPVLGGVLGALGAGGALAASGLGGDNPASPE